MYYYLSKIFLVLKVNGSPSRWTFLDLDCDMTEIFGSWIRRRFIYLPANFAFYSLLFLPLLRLFYFFLRENPPPCTKQERSGVVLPWRPGCCGACPGRGAVARRWRAAPAGAAAAPSGAAISSPLALSGGAPAQPAEPRTQPGTALAPRPQPPRPRPGGSRGTLMWPSPASHHWAAKPALGRGTEMSPFAFVWVWSTKVREEMRLL